MSEVIIRKLPVKLTDDEIMEFARSNARDYDQTNVLTGEARPRWTSTRAS